MKLSSSELNFKKYSVWLTNFGGHICYIISVDEMLTLLNFNKFSAIAAS